MLGELDTHIHSSIVYNSHRVRPTQEPITREELSQRWFINAMLPWLVLKNKGILIHSSTGIALKNIMLRETNQSQVY